MPGSRGKTIILITILTLLTLAPQPAPATKSPYDWAHIQLDRVREEKVAQLRRFTERKSRLAHEAAADPFLLSNFELNRQYRISSEQGEIPPELEAKVEGLRNDLDLYYIRHYFAFHDMIFVDLTGEVFYTIRTETPRRNLFEDGNPAGPLAQRLAARPTEPTFVDFHIYAPSGEAAAFFVMPIEIEGEAAGWIVLQLAINKINALFTSTEDLHHTGETFLVNEDGYMLSESFFEGHSSILNRKLDDRNIGAKFQEGEGHRTVTDYRGSIALSSFEVVEFMGVRWLVVAKIDRAEVTSHHFMDHKHFYGSELLKRLRNRQLPEAVHPRPSHSARALRVDMDEFLRVDADGLIETWGISTCTGLLAAYPGRFAYLAHLSVKDRVMGGAETNLLGQMARNIGIFEIYPYEQSRLIFVVVAPDPEHVPPVVEAIVEKDFLLSQVYVLVRPDARSAALVYDCPSDQLAVSWTAEDGSPLGEGVNHLSDALNVGEMVREIITGEGGHAAEPVD